MRLFRRHRTASNQRVSFRPQLEILEGRDLPSIAGAFQAAVNAGIDYVKLSFDQRQLQAEVNYIQSQPPGTYLTEQGLNLPPIPQALSAVTRDAARLDRDLESLLQNLLPATQPQQQSSPVAGSSSSPPPSPTPTPSQPSPFAGTYTATVVPTQTSFNIPANTKQTLTLSINSDGSGSFGIAPFAGTQQTVEFPGDRDALDFGSVSFDVTTTSGTEFNVTLSLTPGGKAFEGSVTIFNNANNADGSFISFSSVTLNKRG